VHIAIDNIKLKVSEELENALFDSAKPPPSTQIFKKKLLFAI
jgi:hypothetical protein